LLAVAWSAVEAEQGKASLQVDIVAESAIAVGSLAAVCCLQQQGYVTDVRHST